MPKKKDDNQIALEKQMRRIRKGIAEGEQLKSDRSVFHTLEDIPDPVEITFEDEKPAVKKKRAVSAEQLEVLRRNKAPSWQPGQSGNPNGRPKGAVNKAPKDPLKQIGMQIAFTNATLALTPKQKKLARSLGYNPNDIQLIEALMLHLATSANPNKIALFLERTFGKTPNININTQMTEDLVKRFRSKLTDSELEAIADGADVFEILLSKLPDVNEDDDDTGITIHTEDVTDGTYSESHDSS